MKKLESNYDTFVNIQKNCFMYRGKCSEADS